MQSNLPALWSAASEELRACTSGLSPPACSPRPAIGDRRRPPSGGGPGWAQHQPDGVFLSMAQPATWQGLLAAQVIRPHKTSLAELRALHAVVERDLKDPRISEVSAGRRFATAYNAVLQLATMVVVLRRIPRHRLRPPSDDHSGAMGALISPFAPISTPAAESATKSVTTHRGLPSAIRNNPQYRLISAKPLAYARLRYGGGCLCFSSFHFRISTIPPRSVSETSPALRLAQVADGESVPPCEFCERDSN